MFRPRGFCKRVRRAEEPAVAIAVCRSPAAGYITGRILARSARRPNGSAIFVDGARLAR
jgi:hypothetical protein